MMYTQYANALLNIFRLRLILYGCGSSIGNHQPFLNFNKKVNGNFAFIRAGDITQKTRIEIISLHKLV